MDIWVDKRTGGEIYVFSLPDANALVEHIDVRLSEPLLHVVFSDQGRHVKVDLGVWIFFAVIEPVSIPHNASDWGHPVNFIWSFLTAILVSHLFNPLVQLQGYKSDAILLYC